MNRRTPASSALALGLLAGLLLAASAPAEEMAEWNNQRIQFAMSYPAHWEIELDPSTLKALAEKGLKEFDGISEASDGQQFILYAPAEPGVVPANMVLTTAKLSRAEAKVGSKAIAEAAYAQMPSVIPGSIQLNETKPVRLGGKEWYTADFQFVTQGIQFRFRQWVHVSKKTKTMYSMAISGEAPAFDESEAAFAPVLDSLELGF